MWKSSSTRFVVKPKNHRWPDLISLFDSNVWISALRFNGIPRRALQIAFELNRIAICREIETEVQRVLRVKFAWPIAESSAMMNGFLKNALRVSVPGKLRNVCRDPNDDMVIECAVIANAQFIVSGDKDLLSMGSYENIKIVTPKDFLELTHTAI